MVKSLADANQDWKSPRVLLPNKLTMEFDPENDATAKRPRTPEIPQPLKTNPPKKN